MRSEFAPIVRGMKLLIAERAQLAARGPHFVILHRFWKLGTMCTPGEVAAEARLLFRRRQIPLPLSSRLMLLFDYLARHPRLGQNAGQIAAGLNVDPFTREHGVYARAKSSLSKRVSRKAVKQQMMRLRNALGAVLNKAGLNISPNRILIVEKTTTNEVRYRLKASVSWEHQPF